MSAERRNWLVGFSLIFLIHLFGIKLLLVPVQWAPESEGGEHHDAMVMILRIREANDPLKWFVSDWPLYNGFYRPIPSLSYELDHRLYGYDLRLFNITNFLIGLVCSFLLLWLVWELFRRKWPAVACGSLFSFWQSGLYLMLPIDEMAVVLSISCLVIGVFFGRATYGRWIVAAALLFFTFREIGLHLSLTDVTNQSFAFRSTGWSPGRTATFMTMFALISAAGYCRFERERRWAWAAISVAGLLLAFGSYEQSVVIAGVVLACGVALRLQGVQVRWAFHLLPWALTILYVFLHTRLLEPDTRYRLQVYRGTSGGLRDLTRFIFPASWHARLLATVAPLGPSVLLLALPYTASLTIAANIIAYFEARKDWVPICFGLLASVGAYAPLAFQHPLAHYFHLSFAMRTVFVVWLLMLTWRTILSAASRQSPEAIQEPFPARG